MAVTLHRCRNEWVKIAGHPCWKIEKALKDRLPDKLATTLWLDPTTRAVSRAGESREAFAARLGQETAGPATAKLRERLEKKRRDLAAAEQDLTGRKREKWAAWGSAVLSNIGLITGRKAVINKSRKSVANFKLRQGQPIGCRVTLRRDVMYEFFDRLVAAALPRIRDFRGVSSRSFDGRGNYSLGLSDQTIFPEIDLDKIKRHQGMDVSIVTTAPTDEEALDLLKLMGMPFAEGR